MKLRTWFLLRKICIAVVFMGFMFSSCSSGTDRSNKDQKNTATEQIIVPEFNSDSAYVFVEKQVLFGPRVTNTEAHERCLQFLFNTLQQYTDTAMIQAFKARAFDGTVLNGKNIIGSINPDNEKRVLLCAHWDSRPFADYDPNPANQRTPIQGANDGASGVGVLLEVARQLSLLKPGIGVDIVFFDAEDYGPPQDLNMHNGEYWALGSQYWSKNPHNPDYTAMYGILLDMVGAQDARFFMEGFSMDYAAGIVKKVWKTAHRLGFEDYFIFQQVGYIDDDHKSINEYIGIPTIDIIHLDPESSNSSFFEHWHTIGDTMETIDKFSLKVVGQTLLTVVYEQK
ncbi:MAG: M28 family peptidase [Bacteroidales bacterium]